jgi:serine/threonine-protein kinase RsbW
MKENNEIKIILKADQLTICLQSTMENIDKVDFQTKVFLENHNLQSEIFSVCLCMREGLTNGVRHGHKNDSLKILRYSLTRTKKNLIMEIEDEGEGFDWRAFEKTEPVFESDHGRGLAIIRKYFSKYEFNEKGNKLILIKFLPTHDIRNT